jgi:hypothetical protein
MNVPIKECAFRIVKSERGTGSSKVQYGYRYATLRYGGGISRNSF